MILMSLSEYLMYNFLWLPTGSYMGLLWLYVVYFWFDTLAYSIELFLEILVV